MSNYALVIGSSDPLTWVEVDLPQWDTDDDERHPNCS